MQCVLSSSQEKKEMRKSTVAVLVISIVLLVAGIGLSAYGVYLNAPHYASYHYGEGFYSYSVRYRLDMPGNGNGFTAFGRLSFDAGLVLMAIFVFLLVSNKKNEKIAEKKAGNFTKAEHEKAKNEAIDVSAQSEEEKTE